MDLWGPQSNRELVDNVNMGVIRHNQLGKFSHFGVLSVKWQRGALGRILPPKWY